MNSWFLISVSTHFVFSVSAAKWNVNFQIIHLLIDANADHWDQMKPECALNVIANVRSLCYRVDPDLLFPLALCWDSGGSPLFSKKASLPGTRKAKGAAPQIQSTKFGFEHTLELICFQSQACLYCAMRSLHLSPLQQFLSNSAHLGESRSLLTASQVSFYFSFGLTVRKSEIII